MDTSSSPVQLDHISYSFTNKPLFSAISVSFTKNETTAILGRSGSGKSTLLQIINGMVKPASGKVTIFGKLLDYKNLAGVRLQTGYVIQQVGLFPHMTIKENINLLGNITHMPAAQINKRLEHLMEVVQLPLTHLSKYPYQLSGGEQQRAGLCRAMLLNPPLLLMDEPFAALDYTTKHTIYKYLQAMQKNEPRSIILVTHDWEEAMILADNFIWLEEGNVKASGTKNDLAQMKESYLLKA